MTKRFLPLAAAILIIVLVLSACSTGSSGAVKQGLGSVIRIDRSTDAGAEDGSAVIDVVFAAVTLDSSGKILAVNIDGIANAIPFTAQGKLAVPDLAALGQTKRELGNAYGMKADSSLQKEWYQEVDALEAWLVGKTLADINGMKLTNGVSDDLKASVTLNVTDFLTAVKKAIANAQ